MTKKSYPSLPINNKYRKVKIDNKYLFQHSKNKLKINHRKVILDMKLRDEKDINLIWKVTKQDKKFSFLHNIPHINKYFWATCIVNNTHIPKDLIIIHQYIIYQQKIWNLIDFHIYLYFMSIYYIGLSEI